jgi:hypothetical protein
MQHTVLKVLGKWQITSALLIATTCLSCGALVDIEDEPEPVHDVSRYYYPQDSGIHHVFAVSQLGSGGAKYDLEMEMKGRQQAESLSGKPVFRCEWESNTACVYYESFYTVDQDTAAYLGSQLDQALPWLDLVAPMMPGKSWEFLTEMGIVTARVTTLGATAVIKGREGNQKFEGIVEVEYAYGDQKRTKWFAPGVGLIAEWRYDRTGLTESRQLIAQE